MRGAFLSFYFYLSKRILLMNFSKSSPVIQRVQIDQFFDPVWVRRGKVSQLHSRNRVTGETSFFNIQLIHELTNIFCECIGVIACFRTIGITVSSAGESQDVKLVIKARGQLVEDVSGSSHAREKNQRWTFSAPIKIMQTDSVKIYKVTFVIRIIRSFLLFESALPGYPQ